MHAQQREETAIDRFARAIVGGSLTSNLEIPITEVTGTEAILQYSEVFRAATGKGSFLAYKLPNDSFWRFSKVSSAVFGTSDAFELKDLKSGESLTGHTAKEYLKLGWSFRCVTAIEEASLKSILDLV